MKLPIRFLEHVIQNFKSKTWNSRGIKICSNCVPAMHSGLRGSPADCVERSDG